MARARRTSAALVVPLALAHLACRGRHRPELPDAAVTASASPDAGAPSVPTPPSPPPAAWCFTARALADVRALDARGDVWSVRGAQLTDETHQTTVTLASEIPCFERGLWAMEFQRDGSAFLLADSRFYVRPDARAAFSVTPLCTDVKGAPWSRRSAGGWSFVSHRNAAIEPTLMLTRVPAADVGWFAVTGLDPSTHSAVLDGNDAFLALSQGEHLMFVDRANVVAGAVLDARNDTFDGLTRSAAGIVAWHDEGTRRVVVFSEAAAGPFTRVEGARPSQSPARAVLRIDLARFVAVTDREVQLSNDRGAHFHTVLTLPPDADAHALERPSLGWLGGSTLSLAVRGGVASERCP